MENDRSHPYQAEILNHTAMQRDRMPHRHILPEIHAPLLLHAVQDTVVLHVGICPYADLMHISAHYRVHPHRSVLAQHDIADNLCRLVDETTAWYGRPHAFVRSDQVLA